MNAFISYSHNDAEMLTLLHTHLAQLQRDGLISTWTDREILAGGNLNDSISRSLDNSNIFIALLSPSYIASTYCYEKEFVRAIQIQEEGKLVIVPTIVEPCDWLNTPFSKFKALPKDGKAITTWENKNTAFVDVIQNLRKLIENGGLTDDIPGQPPHSEIPKTGRNYRVQKDFDSIQKMEFIEQSFKEIKEHIKRYLQEINELENIRSRIIKEVSEEIEIILVNRNKIATEARLKISIGKDQARVRMFSNSGDGRINYSVSTENNNLSDRGYNLQYDDYDLFWVSEDYYSANRAVRMTVREISEQIWLEWLKSVGIMS
ncbi:hypothetical protein J2Y45_001542 [Dyadobacter sp. BE34]|uniref:TIR domain-containing protein n=1 Tax=Dyadobacter fermentans TaxID=94254 RepID=A0ABU1QSZ1_9BACT|nr:MULTISPECIES: toll/interleukin-1 receptor domain-containing protein [Dyadobacter]MDR6804273.1 hypothetical protein [Dyadobacter fermentans]MDR7042013.1 hypothetical protein [Dyadobacter sp. BE242]MDR7196416.1 hypothetical protein [Dyadobacter sp. BE34]MDR7213039.1 hypothetical protein [Dyadobacter sp. BE31]MDR7261822.1 hypothetical protein [Dyadobacter sp. BE32]